MKNCYFIGIGGVGMSGLARLMLKRSEKVGGSDLSQSAITDELVKAGVTVHIGQAAHQVTSDMTVVYSTDIKKDNVEYQAAVNYQCPLLHRSQLLQLMMEGCSSLAVAGTHGKTTTSSLLTWVLHSCGEDPSYAIGGVIPQLNSNAGHGEGKYFVAEACESDGTFLNYRPYGAIVTNVDFDHMDHYGTENHLKQAFEKFMKQVTTPSHLFWCGDDSRLLGMNPPGISYGFGEHCQLRVSNFQQKEWSIFFDVDFKGKKYRQVEVSLIGLHNALNALAVFGLTLSLGIDEQAIRKGLKTFKGVLRRAEKKGETHGILFYDDYGHHPTEITATLKGFRNAIGDKRLVVLYQPHRYSRAKECMGMYRDIFNDADLLFVSEIYAAREKPIPGVSHVEIIAEIQANRRQPCHHVERSKMAETILPSLRPHDVVLTLGAGDITKVSGEIISLMNHKTPPKIRVGVICGGESVEHEVSLLSVKHILASLNPEYYEIEQFYITNQGEWCIGRESKPSHGPKVSPEVMQRLHTCDILFPVLHGTYGEDGTIQGFFEMISKPYVGCDYRSSAVSMDKAITKKLMRDAHIDTLPFVSFSRGQWKKDESKIRCSIKEQLHYPLFVKPTHLGSSIGVHKVKDEQELRKAIEKAFLFDTHILVENGVEAREIEFAVLGNDEVKVFPPGEICSEGKVYDYASKYGPNGMKATPKAEVDPDLVKKGMEMARRAYEAAGCVGMARVDTFLDRNNKFWLNEINPIPGFTKISLYPQICEVNGLAAPQLMDQLIILGLQRRRQIDSLQLKMDPA